MLHGFRGVFVSLVNWEPAFPEFPAGLWARGTCTRFEKQPLTAAGATLTFMTERSTGPTGPPLSSLPFPNPCPALLTTASFTRQPCPKPTLRLWLWTYRNKTEAESPDSSALLGYHLTHSKVDCSVMSNSLPPHGLYSPWNSPGQNTGVGAYPFSRGSSQPRNRIRLSCTTGGFFTNWASKEAQYTQKHIFLSAVFNEFWQMYTHMCQLSQMKYKIILLAEKVLFSIWIYFPVLTPRKPWIFYQHSFAYSRTLYACHHTLSNFFNLAIFAQFCGHRTDKDQFSFQSERRAMPNNVQTTIKLCSKSFKLASSSTWTENFLMYNLGLEKAEEPETKLPTFVGS